MATETKKTVWTPLESNPETMTKLINDIGVTGIRCEDIFGFDADCLAFVPKPHLGAILCFPDYKKCYNLVKPKYDALKSDNYKPDEKLFFMKQKIGNACGTFAILHSLANLTNTISVGSGPFAAWLAKAKLLSIEDRSACLEHDKDMAVAHESSARSGETDADVPDVEHHFIALVNVDGTLYEFDGQMDFPRPLGPTTPDTVLEDVGKLVNEMIAGLDNSISFNAIALVGDA
uniref:Ubiquitin carboxyl-terminal hydrolase n=1 Tax=Panagrellus redivivus TaxID=6233 RepID=A0A7E4WBJ2_PANRE